MVLYFGYENIYSRIVAPLFPRPVSGGLYLGMLRSVLDALGKR